MCIRYSAHFKHRRVVVAGESVGSKRGYFVVGTASILCDLVRRQQVTQQFQRRAQTTRHHYQAGTTDVRSALI